jgi:hypothetical protein
VQLDLQLLASETRLEQLAVIRLTQLLVLQQAQLPNFGGQPMRDFLLMRDAPEQFTLPVDCSTVRRGLLDATRLCPEVPKEAEVALRLVQLRDELRLLPVQSDCVDKRNVLATVEKRVHARELFFEQLLDLLEDAELAEQWRIEVAPSCAFNCVFSCVNFSMFE